MLIYLKKFESFSNLMSDSEYLDNLEDLKLSTDWDDNRAKEDLDYYLGKIETLQKNGGLIYRLVWLFSEDELNKDILGYHWNIDGDFDNFYNSLETTESNDIGNEKKPFLIIAKTKPGNIKLSDSISYYTELPTELEINLEEDPLDYKIIPYERYRDYSHIRI